jgi:hypothetical protein
LGSPLTFVADVTVDPSVRVNANFHIHLKAPLTIGTINVAPANTPAQLFVTAKRTGKDGVTHYDITIAQFRIKDLGTLPVVPVHATVDTITAGMDIPVTTAGAVISSEGRLRITVPLPITLSNDAPQAGYTPAPIRTAGPYVPLPRRGARPTVPPAPATPSPSPEPTADPAVSPAPAASP